MNNVLFVNEIFGLTFQGEGRSLGMPCYFLRLSGCNQHCVWCDTPYTWRFSDKYPHQGDMVYDPTKESHKMTENEVLNKLRALQVAHHSNVSSLVISGGEPMLQQSAWKSLVAYLARNTWHVEVETAGTIAPLPGLEVEQFNVSLKLKNSGNPTQLRRKEGAIKAFAKDPRANFKFVVTDISDFEEIDYLTNSFQIYANRVYIMPEGIDPATIRTHAQKVAKETLARGYNLTTRMQIQLYGNQRGI